MIARFRRWLRNVLDLDTRYGVRFGRGTRERTGFRTDRHARAWAEEFCRPGDYLVFRYEPIDLRLPGGHRGGMHTSDPPERNRYVGHSEAP